MFVYASCWCRASARYDTAGNDILHHRAAEPRASTLPLIRDTERFRNRHCGDLELQLARPPPAQALASAPTSQPPWQKRYLRAILIELNEYSSCIWSLSVLTSSQTHWSVPSKQIVLKA